MTPTFTVIIPARMASTRLPGKPLLDIAGKPMIARVVEQALASSASRVVVATDNERVAESARAAGAIACMTAVDHASGTDRLQEAARIVGLAGTDTVVNVQGDEPLIPPAVIDQVAAQLHDSGAAMASLYEYIREPALIADPNVVKVVTNEADEALYFSRAPIPFDRDGEGHDDCYKKHLGIYAYRVELLDRFVAWRPSMLELVEKLEQLRAMAHGVTIRMACAAAAIPPGVDTEADLLRVRQTLGG